MNLPSYQTDNFLGLDEAHSAFDTSRVLILPIPYEATVTFGGGTRHGPRAILHASTQVELYDRELDAEPALEFGVHTLPALAPVPAGPAEMVDAIEAAVAEYAATGKLVVGLGGEHTISVGFARGLRRVHGDFVTVQIDAHADLRDTYEGTPYSHACVARRLVELSPLVQLGIRSLSREEAEFIRTHPHRVRTFFAEDIHAGQYLDALARRVHGQKVFLTIDVDALDPSIVPATGTPEPAGLTWNQVLSIIRIVAREAQTIGFDCVELAPQPGQHASDFIVAKLVYQVMSLVLMQRK